MPLKAAGLYINMDHSYVWCVRYYTYQTHNTDYGGTLAETPLSLLHVLPSPPHPSLPLHPPSSSTPYLPLHTCPSTQHLSGGDRANISPPLITLPRCSPAWMQGSEALPRVCRGSRAGVLAAPVFILRYDIHSENCTYMSGLRDEASMRGLTQTPLWRPCS